MNGAENKGEEQAVPQPKTSNNEPQVEKPTPEDSSHSANGQNHNWSEARSAIKELAEKNRLLEQKITQISSPAKKEPEINEFDSLAHDDIITKGQLLQREQNLEKKFAQLQSLTAEERLEAKHSDFRSVTSPENIHKLKEKYPDLAKSIASNEDVFSQGKAAYDLIISTGISNRDVQINREKMEANSQKPQMGTVGAKAGALDSAHLFESGQRPALTESLKSTLRKEMTSAIKSR